MNATTTFWPSASSPMSVAGPSASTSPALHHVARRTIGFWLAGVLVRALELDQV
jgi:hypothetical protein